MAAGPVTTIPPFSDQGKLPLCAASCGALYDANGACVPPAASTAEASVYTSCFCKNTKVNAFSTATTGVCDDACQGPGLNSIATWFRDICSVDGNSGNGNNNDNNNDGQTTTTGGSSGSKSGSSNNSGGGGDWLSNHWQWVIMLVVLVVAIAGIWVGACIWRRRYIKKKDRQTTWGQKQSGSRSHPSWGPGTAPPNLGEAMNAAAASPAAGNSPSTGPGAFMPGPSGSSSEEKPKEKKRWKIKKGDS